MAMGRHRDCHPWYFIGAVLVVLLLGNGTRWRGEEKFSWVNAHGLYSSHNFCISNAVDYTMELFADEFSVDETIGLRPLENVFECYFYAEKFDVHMVTARRGNKEQQTMEEFDPELQLLPFGVYSLRIANDKLWSHEMDYTVTFNARKSFSKVGEGLTFKVYRERSTFKRSWYAFVHMSPSQCGKAFFCTNNLKDLHTLKIQSIHWKTHNLNCAGKTTTRNFSNDKAKSVCENTFKVGVNNLHYSLTKFPKMEYVSNTSDGKALHYITIVGPENEQSVLYPRIVEHFQFILRIYSLLLLTMNLKQFHAIFYVFPNYHKEVPEVFSGSCYFKLENILYNIDLEMTQRSYLKCLLHQGFMNGRVSDSWVLRYVPEGLFEQLVNTYEVQGVKNDYYKNVLLGDEDDLDSLAKYDRYLGDIRLKRPWRKAAGFWHMLGSISPIYGRNTFGEFAENGKPIETQAEFVKWVTKDAHLLALEPVEFLNMLYTWTAPKGYPILVAKVEGRRYVCVSQYGGNFPFHSRLIPYVLEYNYPNAVQSNVIWVQSQFRNNCHTAQANLYPYLINGNLNMVGRVLYDPLNWESWSLALMRKNVRLSMPTMQRVSLIMDALFFAKNNQLDWKMSIKFLALVRDETDELAWRNFDKVLEYLESLTRYTQIYLMFKNLVAEVVRKYYYSKPYPSGIAIKWFCMAGVLDCYQYTEAMTHRAIADHDYMPNVTEVLCGGMRRLTIERFREMIASMGSPDWREPIFYIEIMTCANNWQIPRELMQHLFFYRSWQFRASLLKSLIIRMIEMGKAGSDAVLTYVNHNPLGMLQQLEEGNLLEVFDALARYTRDSMWLQRFIKRTQLRRSWDNKSMQRFERMFDRMKSNKRWYNVHYDNFAMYLTEGYLIQWGEYEL